MKRPHRLLFLTLAALLSPLLHAQQPPPESLPANVAGKWIVYAKDPNHTTSTKYLDIEQNGNVIKGHFKGPYQSGGIEGTIDKRHIVFKTKTRHVLTFHGHVEGERVDGVIQGTTIQGGFHAEKGEGEWQAVRPGP